MNARRWLGVLVLVVLVGGAVAVARLSDIVRHVAIARLEAMTRRPVTIDGVDVALLSGRVTVRGLTVTERDGTPFVELARLDTRVHLPSLIAGHVRLRELTLSEPIVRIVRLPGGAFNISDLVERSGEPRKAMDLTVERFRMERGRASLEDRALPDPKTWTSEELTIEAHEVSTRTGGGRATGSSITAGAPTSFTITNLRLHPIHMEAVAKVEGLDVTPARVYLPPDAHVRLDGGRVTATLAVVVDATDGIRANGTARLTDVTMAEPGKGQPLARAPLLTAEVRGFALREGALTLEQLTADGTVNVRDPRAAGGTLRPSTVRARVASLTWPATTPGTVDVRASVPGGGTVAVTGTVQPPPAATQLSVRISRLDLAPWTQLVPLAARISGIADADLRINEPLAAGVPTRVLGTASVTGLTVADARQEVLRARYVEASGLEVRWPSHVAVRRVLVSGPRGTIERDASGAVVMPFAPMEPVVAAKAPAPSAASRTPALTVGELIVRDGALAVRDAAVKPPARLDVSAIEATVTGGGWPLKGPLTVRASLRPPGGGALRASGRIGLEPISADLRVSAAGAELAPYQPYLPTRARITGAADFDLAVVVPSLDERRATARGTATLTRLDVRDGLRTVLRAERAAATGVDVAWPERVTIDRLALAGPWLLLERDDEGELALRALAPPSARAETGADAGADNALAIRITRLTADDGGLRVVDRAIAPAFAVDVDRATLRVDGLGTTPGRPARLDLNARVGGTADLVLRGTVGPLSGPLRLEVDGELREFAVPRANSYLQSQVGWTARAGQVTTKLHGRVDGDALNAKTDIRVSRLQLVRAERQDAAQARIGLPLGTLTSLMKDRRGDINLSFPIGGRLGDPRFDFREAIWSAVRAVAINAITLPVSWIGRVRMSADSRIERIEVDPLTFEPGTATLTADAEARVSRLKAFLDQLPEVRMAMTPVVSSGDLTAIKRRIAQTTLPGGSASAEGSALPRGDVIDRIPVPSSAVPDLAERRADAVRAAMRKAGIDAGRVTETAMAEREGAASQVELQVIEPAGTRPSKIRDTLRRLLPGKNDE